MNEKTSTNTIELTDYFDKETKTLDEIALIQKISELTNINNRTVLWLLNGANTDDEMLKNLKFTLNGKPSDLVKKATSELVAKNQALDTYLKETNAIEELVNASEKDFIDKIF